MAPTLNRKQHINLRGESQLEMSDSAPPITEDFEGKLAEAQTQLEMLHAQRRDLERQKLALEDLNHRKQEFMSGQLDLVEKLSSAITTIEREVFESKQEVDDLEQTRQVFANHLKSVEGLNPEAWPKESLSTELEGALMTLDKAEDEYEQAVSYFTSGRKGSIFGGRSSMGRTPRGLSGEFQTNLQNGLAFNLPVLVMGSIAILVYLIK